MKTVLIFSLISKLIATTQGVCTDSRGNPVSDLSVSFTTPYIVGTKSGGFSITCKYSTTGSHELFLWSIEKSPDGAIFDVVYTYSPGNSPAEEPGAKFVNRNLTFKNGNTVVFPNMMPDDKGSDTYRCTVLFNTALFECTETSVLTAYAEPVVSYEPYCLQRHSEENLTVTGTDYLTAQASPVFIIELNGENNTLQTTITNQSDGFQMFTSSIDMSFNTKTVKNRLFMVVGDSSSTVYSPEIKTELDPTPFLAIAVIMVVLEVTVIIVLIGFAANEGSGKVVRWILFINSIVIIVLGVIFVIVLPVEACKPLESEGIAAVVFSSIAIPLAVVGLILAFKWKSENINWILC